MTSYRLRIGVPGGQSSGGTITSIGSLALTDHLNQVRENMGPITGETEAEVDARMGGTRQQIIDYCGMVVSADGRYVSFPINAGHSATGDDGFYQYDLQTETFVYPPPVWPSQYGSSSGSTANSFGEYTSSPSGFGRPADQHSYSHNLQIGNDIVQAMGYAVSVNGASASKQAHIWRASTGAWERYGSTSGGVSGQITHCFHDSIRGRIVRFTAVANDGTIDTIPDNLSAGDDTTAWTSQTITTSGGTYVKWLDLGIGQCMGYHPTLDCYVVVAPGVANGGKRVRVMDAANITAGWTEATGSDGVTPATNIAEQLLSYIPPMDCFVLGSPDELNKLYYLRPPISGVITDPWTWESETFTGTAAQWGRAPTEKWIESRLQWSELKQGIVAWKNATNVPELFVPMEVAAYYDWQARVAAAYAAGTATGRGAAAYDFSAQPANGGDWTFGSLTETPKVTVEVPWDSITYDTPGTGVPDHARDLEIYPPGSRGSLRMTTRTGVFNATDQWRISIDEYSKQFREGDEFWVCWRTRMNEPYATHRFKSNDNGFSLPSEWNLGGYSEFKSVMFGYGMQYPNPPGTYYTSTRTDYGYSPGASHSDNVLTICQTDCLGEIVMISNTDQMVPGGPGGWMKYPNGYIGKTFDGIETRGQNSSYFTLRNGGVETSGASRLCEYIDPGGGVGNQYTDYSSCFIYPTDEWFSLMVHVILGPQGTAPQYGSGPSRTGYTDSTLEYYGAYDGQPWSLLHKRSNLTFHSDSTQPGSDGVGRYGTFNWTTYITTKYAGDVHEDAIVWVSQIIVQPGATMPAAPI